MNPATGFVNAHTHLYSGLAPFGMPAPAEPPADFVAILENVWWKLDRALDARSLRAAARWYVAEALQLGTVGLIDHHESPNLIEGSLDILADACQAAGMPAVLCYGATERNGGRDEARRGLAECRRFIETNTRPLVRGVVGLHASFTVSDETRVYKHQWQAGETILWDNRSLLHRAMPYDYTKPRVLIGTRVAGDPSSELAYYPTDPQAQAGRRTTDASRRPLHLRAGR